MDLRRAFAKMTVMINWKFEIENWLFVIWGTAVPASPEITDIQFSISNYQLILRG
jgi:hypothetical protein